MGSLASMGSAYLLCKAFGLEDALVATMLPKSVTTPIAMAVSETLGGIVPVTVAGRHSDRHTGRDDRAAADQNFPRHRSYRTGRGHRHLFPRHRHDQGHGAGELQGAMSSIAIGVAGLMTVLISLFL